MVSLKRFKKNKGIVKHVLYKFSYDYSLRKDLLQDCYEEFWKACLEYDDDVNCSFSTYAYRRVYFKLIKLLKRKYGKYIEQEESQDKDPGFETVEGSINTKSSLIDTSDIIKHRYMGYTWPEIGEFNNITGEAARVRFKKEMKTLCQKI